MGWFVKMCGVILDMVEGFGMWSEVLSMSASHLRLRASCHNTPSAARRACHSQEESISDGWDPSLPWDRHT